MSNRTAGELARFLGCALDGDAQTTLAGVASPERARREDLIYLESPRHVDRVLASAAHCVVAAPGAQLAGKTLLLATRPKLAFSRAAAWLAPAALIARGIHATAIIGPSTSLGPGVAVGPYAVIEDDAVIGADTQIGAFCFVGRGAHLGRDCRLYPRVTLYAGARLGNSVIVHAGAVLGSDGFGYVADAGALVKFPQQGALEIADDVEIGANATIDRGSLEVTSIGAQAKLDNLVHVAHNVRIGERTLIAAQTGIAGSATVGSDTVLGGQVGVADHVHIEDNCAVGGQAGIPAGKTIRRGQIVWGTPARPLARFKQQYAALARLARRSEEE